MQPVHYYAIIDGHHRRLTVRITEHEPERETVIVPQRTAPIPTVCPSVPANDPTKVVPETQPERKKAA